MCGSRIYRPVKLHIPSLSSDAATEYESVEGISGSMAENELSFLNMKNELAECIVSSVQTEVHALNLLTEIQNEMKMIAELELEIDKIERPRSYL